MCGFSFKKHYSYAPATRYVFEYLLSTTFGFFHCRHLLSSSEKFWFCRLSLNHKVLHYGDLDESPQGEVPLELLTDKSESPGCNFVSPPTPSQ